MSNKIFNLHKHELKHLAEWAAEQNKSIYFYSAMGFETSLLLASTKELKDEEIKILIDAYLVTDDLDLIKSDDDDFQIWDDGDDIDEDWFFL